MVTRPAGAPWPTRCFDHALEFLKKRMSEPSEESVDTKSLSVKKLRALVKEAGLSLAGVHEKADLIKKAMVDVDRALSESDLGATMIMQVHDELVFETTEDERDALTVLITERMEQVAELSVPLTVDVGFGPNWREAH